MRNSIALHAHTLPAPHTHPRPISHIRSTQPPTPPPVASNQGRGGRSFAVNASPRLSSRSGLRCAEYTSDERRDIDCSCGFQWCWACKEEVQAIARSHATRRGPPRGWQISLCAEK